MAWVVWGIASPLWANSGTPPAQVVGSVFEYTVQAGDTLTSIGGRFGVAVPVLIAENRLATPDRIRPGIKLTIDNRHIVPANLDTGMVINIPQRILFYFTAGELKATYPVALGRPDWPTPTGKFEVASLVLNPDWHVPKSIQEEMAREEKIVTELVPAGPDNPLGTHWIGLSLAGYGIHGTSAPMSIYQFRSHGCIRLHPEDIEKLFSYLKRGFQGELAYKTVLLGQDDQGKLFLEVNPDIYRKNINALEQARRLADSYGVKERIDWSRVATVIESREGIAREVSL